MPNPAERLIADIGNWRPTLPRAADRMFELQSHDGLELDGSVGWNVAAARLRHLHIAAQHAAAHRRRYESAGKLFLGSSMTSNDRH